MKIEKGQSVIFYRRMKLRVASIDKGEDGKTYYELWSGATSVMLTEDELLRDIEMGEVVPLEKDTK